MGSLVHGVLRGTTITVCICENVDVSHLFCLWGDSDEDEPGAKEPHLKRDGITSLEVAQGQLRSRLS